MTIPIENLYYVLAYAYRGLPAGGVAALGAVNAHAQADLLARALAAAVRGQIRRGLVRGYVARAEDTAAPRGRIDIGETTRRALRGQVHVHVDDFVADVPANRLVLATLHRLLRTADVRKETRAAIREVLPAFAGVARVPLDSRAFRPVDVHAGARPYRFLVELCALVYRGLLPTEHSGRYRFRDLLRDEVAMRALFQQFVFEFFRREQRAFRVESEKRLRWDFEPVGPSASALVPEMRIDILLTDRTGDRAVVIDTKYTSALGTPHHGVARFKSAHLYQLATYLRHAHQVCGASHVEGLLLYPAVGRALDEVYRFGPHRVRVCTLDLGQAWPGIHADLLGLLGATAVLPPRLAPR